MDPISTDINTQIVVENPIDRIHDLIDERIMKLAVEVFDEIYSTADNTKTNKDFAENYVKAKQGAFSETDERTHKFFQRRICAPIIAHLACFLMWTNLPPKDKLNLLNATNQLGELVAYPKTKALVEELDHISPAIVDEILSDKDVVNLVNKCPE